MDLRSLMIMTAWLVFCIAVNTLKQCRRKVDEILQGRLPKMIFHETDQFNNKVRYVKMTADGQPTLSQVWRVCRSAVLIIGSLRMPEAVPFVMIVLGSGEDCCNEAIQFTLVFLNMPNYTKTCLFFLFPRIQICFITSYNALI